VALLPALLIFGNLSDAIGRRATILMGLGLLLLGAVAFAIAPSLPWVFAGRALMGFGVGLSLGPATAAMIEFSAPGRAARAGSATTAATATGLALATLIGGFLVQYAPAPMHLPFWVLAAVIAVAGVLSWFLPRTAPADRTRWRPRPLHLPRTARGTFVAGVLGISGAYAAGALYLSLGAQIARELVRSDNAFVDGAIISLSAIAIGVVAVLTRGIDPRVSIAWGAPATVVGVGVLAASGLTHSLVLFLASSVVGGAGYSLLFAGGLGLIARAAPVHHRAAALSTAYLAGYLLQAIAALALGAMATLGGLQLALDVGGPVISLVGIAALVAARLSAGGRSPATTERKPV
jgi:predicted MFS family arabinose efflux permease